MNFEDLVSRFDSGEITEAVIDELLTILHPDDAEARQERKERVMPGGEMVKFQVVGLNKQAQQAYQQRLNQPESKPEVIEVPDQFQDDIPDEVYDGPNYVDEIKSRVGIIQAVRTWGKPQTRIKDQRVEGVKVRCPYSDHVDNDPSAWVNTSKQTWYCGKCTLGGDVIDFYAAAKYDLDPRQYHRTPEFARIVQEMADELGISIVSTSDGGQYVEARTDEWASNQLDKEPEVEVERAQPVATVPASHEATEPITITDDELLRGLELDDDLDDDFFDTDNLPTLDWRDLGIPEGTFLHSWMTQAEIEQGWVPPEFFVALGFQAIGICCGHSTTSRSYTHHLTGATMVMLVGATAGGKSTALSRLENLIKYAVGTKRDEVTGEGVRVSMGVSSPEAFLDEAKTEIYDVLDPNTPPVEKPTNLWYVEQEFATFSSRSKRQGGEHIKQRFIIFHDFYKDRDEPKVVVSDHSRAGGRRSVRDTYFTGTFLVQNKALHHLAEREDLESGFFNRILFFVGRKVGEPPFEAHFDPDPPYVKMFERMWKDCQFKKKFIPFSDDAQLLLETHPLKQKLSGIEDLSDMFSRWRHQVCRFAFLLAVNENSPFVEPQHVSAAYHLVWSYTIPCASSVVKFVQTPEESEGSILSTKIEEWVQGQFDNKGLWPELREIRTQRWWRAAEPVIRNKALDLMFKEQRLVTVILVDTPGVAGKRTHVVTPTGDFAVYDRAYTEKEKTCKYDEFYSGNKRR